MKKIIFAIAKPAARWVLGYTGKAAAAALDKTNERLSDNDYAAALCAWAKDSATLFADFAAALEDKTVTDEERARVAASAQTLGDRLKSLIV